MKRIHVVEISFEKCRNQLPSRKRVPTLDSVFASTRSPSQADTLQNDTEDSSTDGEQIKGKGVADESSERKTANFSLCLLKATL